MTHSKEWFLKFPSAFTDDNHVIILSNPILKVSDSSGELNRFVKKLEAGLACEELKKYSEHSRPAHFFQILKQKNLVSCQKKISPGPLWRHDRTLAWLNVKADDSCKSWELVRTSRILLLGCGGVGAAVAEQLTAMGFRNLILLDGDQTEVSNFNRQTIYAQKDIGRSKVSNLKGRLLERNPDLNITTYKLWLETERCLEQVPPASVDLIVVAIDHPPCLYQQWVLRYGYRYSIPCVFAGVGTDLGYWGPFLRNRKEISSYKKQLSETGKGLISSETSVIRGSLCAGNHLISSWLSFDIFNYISGSGVVHSAGKKVFLYFDSLTFKFRNYTDGNKEPDKKYAGG